MQATTFERALRRLTLEKDASESDMQHYIGEMREEVGCRSAEAATLHMNARRENERHDREAVELRQLGARKQEELASEREARAALARELKLSYSQRVSWGEILSEVMGRSEGNTAILTAYSLCQLHIALY